MSYPGSTSTPELSQLNQDFYVFATMGIHGHTQPGSRLVHYGMGPNADGTTNPTVIYASFVVNGLPAPMDEVFIR